MKKFVSIIFLAPLAVTAADYSTNISFCDSTTSCSKCIETVNVTFISDVNQKILRIKGMTATNEKIDESIQNCEFYSLESWACSSYRGKISMAHGKISYQKGPHDLLVDGKKIEVCFKPT